MTDNHYRSLYELTHDGLELFKRIMTAQASDGELDIYNLRLARPIEGTGPFRADSFTTAKEMAAAIIESLKVAPHSMAARQGLWAWLTFALRDTLFVRKGGVRTAGEVHKWFPSPPGDFQKAQRHLVRMPVLLLGQLGEDADHLLCGKPSVHSEMREQLTSQQDMMSRSFQAVARQLYFDPTTGSIKRGAASKERPGVARRLAQVRKQLDVTWDITDLPRDKILALLPAEFDAFRSST